MFCAVLHVLPLPGTPYLSFVRTTSTGWFGFTVLLVMDTRTLLTQEYAVPRIGVRVLTMQEYVLTLTD